MSETLYLHESLVFLASHRAFIAELWREMTRLGRDFETYETGLDLGVHEVRLDGACDLLEKTIVRRWPSYQF